MPDPADAVLQLRSMWEFAATWKILSLLSVPLSFTRPSPSALETALLHPAEHLALVANLHGRLLGISAGAASSKKWMQAVSRFVRQRPDEFAFLDCGNISVAKEDPDFLPPKDESEEEEALEAPLEEENGNAAAKTTRPRGGRFLTLPQLFPVEEELYISLRPHIRLRVLHTVAELVICEYDSLLSAGTMADIDPNDLRVFPVGSDAARNLYWYFGDFERVYREPGEDRQKTRRQQVEEDTKLAAAAAKEAGLEAAKAARELKRAEARRKKEDVERRRLERKKKSMEKWAPRVAARRTTRASSRAVKSIEGDAEILPSDSHALKAGSSSAMAAEEDGQSSGSSGGEDDAEAELIAEIFGESNSANVSDVENEPGSTRRVSTRRRKRPSTVEEPSAVSLSVAKTPKRPRKADSFLDSTLRNCDGWELFSVGGNGLRSKIERFRPNESAVLSTERTLVRRLEEVVLPAIVENDDRLRREEERLERKKRVEATFTITKRSSRVQALALKREEEAKRVAEEEEVERRRLQEIANHDEYVSAQVMLLEREQSREIRLARRAHGRTEAIERDDHVTKPKAPATRQKGELSEDGPVRRSARASRSSKRGQDDETVADTKRLHMSYSPPARTDMAKGEASAVEEGRNGAGKTHGGEDSASVKILREGVGQPLSTKSGPETFYNRPPNPLKNETEVTPPLMTAVAEDAVEGSFTWDNNPEDGKPMRVLDKFFFVLKADFVDAPLELSETQDDPIVGFGILVPRPGCLVAPQRAELGAVTEWSIEYGSEPKLWVKSEFCWYELRSPAIEYEEAFSSTKRKYELCTRIQILGDGMKPSQLTYDEVVNLLSLRYEKMSAYTESEILAEKRFILLQLTALNKRSLMTSGFVKELQKKVRSDTAKAAAEERKELARRQREDAAERSRAKSAESAENAAEVESKKVVDQVKRQVKPKAASGSRKAVPRAVTVIVNSVLRAATKSKAPRKRKPKANESAADPNEEASLPIRKSKEAGSMAEGAGSEMRGENAKSPNADVIEGLVSASVGKGANGIASCPLNGAVNSSPASTGSLGGRAAAVFNGMPHGRNQTAPRDAQNNASHAGGASSKSSATVVEVGIR